MGLLDPKDWTAQWLAVEDAVAKADREAGLHWIWGDAALSSKAQKFRFRCTLPGPPALYGPILDAAGSRASSAASASRSVICSMWFFSPLPPAVKAP